MAELQLKMAVYLSSSVLMGMLQQLKAGVNWYVAKASVNIVNLARASAAKHGVREAAANFHCVFK